MERRYANPPIIEAVCEFRFTQETKWDLTIPGLFYEMIKNEYPVKMQQYLQGLEVTAGAEPQLRPKILTEERIFFYTEDQKALIQIGQNMLAINCLKPYPTWKMFNPRIELAFKNLNTIIAEKGLQRIGLRYINHIEIPHSYIDLGDYFDFSPHLGENLPQDMIDFLVRCRLPFVDGRDICTMQLTNDKPEKDGQSAFILDFDYYLAKKESISVEDAISWVNSAHIEIQNVFEGCIKDPLRDIFQEIK